MRGKKLHCLDAFREGEQSSWDLADLVAADVVERTHAAEETLGEKGLRSLSPTARLFDAVETIRLDLAGEGVERASSYLKKLYETSDAWAPNERFRPEEASFSAHLILRREKYRNRAQILAKLVAKHHHVNARQVQRWVSEAQPKKPLPAWEERVPERLRAWSNHVLGKHPTRQALQALAVIMAEEVERLEELARRR
jgi:hypothetical protein